MENINPLESPQVKAVIDNYYPFLVEVRKRVMFTLIFFVLATISGFVFYEKIIKLLVELLSLKGVNIVFTSPFQFINLAISCGFAAGLILTSPIVIYQIVSFLKPALRKREYNLVVRSIPFTLILFLSGFAFGTFIMKWQIELFLTTSQSLGIGNILDISSLLNTIILTCTLLGISFEFPIVLLILLRLGIIKPASLRKIRLWIYLASFIFAIFLPVDSIVADILLALPLIILFELTLILNQLMSFKK